MRQTSSPNAPSCKSRETETLATTPLLFGKDSPHHWQYSHSPAIGYTQLYQTISNYIKLYQTISNYIKLFRPEIPDFANSSAMTLKGFKRFVEVLACNDPALAHTCPFAEVVLLSASRTLPPAQNSLSPGREEGIPSTTAVWRQRLLCKTLLKQHQTLLWYPCDRECFHWFLHFLQVLIQTHSWVWTFGHVLNLGNHGPKRCSPQLQWLDQRRGGLIIDSNGPWTIIIYPGLLHSFFKENIFRLHGCDSQRCRMNWRLSQWMTVRTASRRPREKYRAKVLILLL